MDWTRPLPMRILWQPMRRTILEKERKNSFTWLRICNTLKQYSYALASTSGKAPEANWVFSYFCFHQCSFTWSGIGKMCMPEMWEILGLSTPPSWQRGPSNKHSVIKSELRVVGNPRAGIDSSFSQSLISSVSSEVRSWRPLSRTLRFGSLLIRREVRVLGNRPSSTVFHITAATFNLKTSERHHSM